MALEKVSNGLIFVDLFNEHNLLWTITPLDNSRYEYTNDGVILKHGEGRVLMTIPSPYDYTEYAIEIEYSHVPKAAYDVSGVAILSTTDDSIEFQNYFNYSVEEYKYLRIICKVEVYYFYASIDGIKWIELGNSRLPNANRIGLFLDGNSEEHQNLLVKSMKVYSSPYASISGINASGDIIRIEDKDGNLIENVQAEGNGNVLKIDLKQANNPIECRVVVIDSTINTILYQSDLITIDCGDKYEETSDVIFYFNSIELNREDVYDIGILSSSDNYMLFSIFNNSDTNTLDDKLISISQYAAYSYGHEKVKIAFYEEGKNYNELDYHDELNIKRINPKETIKFILKIQRSKTDGIPVGDDTYKFKVNLE